MLEFENKISAVLKNCSSEAIFLAAVSGGADSIAMLAALSVLVPKDRLFCFHVEHSLRPAQESGGDAEFVRGFCEKNEINFRMEVIAPGKIKSFSRRRKTGIEAAARFFRRRAFLKEAARLGNNTVILTAHTKDDALELTFMRILRGAGAAGLAAMPERKGIFLRPLLSVTRAGIIDYLKEKEIPWREDSTNTDEKFLRNRVRRRLVPLLNEFFPVWKKGLSAMAETQSFAADFISDEARRRICWERDNGVIFTDSEIFFSQPQILREEAFYIGIDILLAGKNPVNVKRSVIRRFCAGTVKSADLGLMLAKWESGKILLRRTRNNSSETGFSLLINEPGLYNLNSIGIKILPYSQEMEGLKQSFNCFYAGLPLVLRQSFNDDFLVSKGKKVTRGECASLKIQGGSVISAVDMCGTAAFIERAHSDGSVKILFIRDFIPETVFMVELFLR